MEEPNISKYLKSSRTPTSDEWEMFPAEPYPVRKIKFDTFNELEYFDIRPKYDATEEELEDAIQDFLQAPDKYWCDLEARMKKMFRNVDHEEEAATLHSLQRWRESWFTNHTRLVPSIFPWTDAATIFCFLRLFLEDDGHAIPNQPSPLIDKSSFNETYFLGRRLSYDATQDQVKECIADFYGAPNTYWEDLKFRVGKFKLDHPRNKRIPSEFQLMLCKRDYWLAKTPFHPIKSYYPWKDLHEICVLLRKLKEANLGSASLCKPSFYSSRIKNTDNYHSPGRSIISCSFS